MIASAGAPDPGAPLSGPAGWVLDVLASLGAWGVGLLVALENLFPPVPSEVVLPLAGFLAGQGRLSLAGVLVASTAGSLAGALLLYWAGAALGTRRLCRLADRLPLMDGRDVESAGAWFDRHGRAAVLFGRMVPGVRSLVSVPAGVERMPLGQFALLTVIGSGAWNALFVGLGYVLGSRWQQVGRYSDWINYGVGTLIVVAVAVFVGRRLRRVRRGEDPVTGEPRPPVDRADRPPPARADRPAQRRAG